MNWVGGARNRIKVQQEKRKQQEFFEKKRAEKMKNDKTSLKSQLKLSQDLIFLQTINNCCDDDRLYSNGNKIRKVDLNTRIPTIFSKKKSPFPLPKSPFTVESKLDSHNSQATKSNETSLHLKSNCVCFNPLKNKPCNIYEKPALQTSKYQFLSPPTIRNSQNVEAIQLSNLHSTPFTNPMKNQFPSPFLQNVRPSPLSNSFQLNQQPFLERNVTSDVYSKTFTSDILNEKSIYSMDSSLLPPMSEDFQNFRSPYDFPYTKTPQRTPRKDLLSNNSRSVINENIRRSPFLTLFHKQIDNINDKNYNRPNLSKKNSDQREEHKSLKPTSKAIENNRKNNVIDSDEDPIKSTYETTSSIIGISHEISIETSIETVQKIVHEVVEEVVSQEISKVDAFTQTSPIVCSFCKQLF